MLIRDTIFHVLDFETTGLDPLTDRVVEMAVVPCSVGNGVACLPVQSRLFNPGFPIPPAASAIHHITDSDVDGLPLFDTFDMAAVGGPNDAFAAHNADFDMGFIQGKTIRPVICTMRLAKKLWPDLESYSNQYLRYFLKLSLPLEIKAMSMHRALPDALVTAHLLLRELREVIALARNPDEATVEKLVAWIAEPILLTTVRFGKHKGEKWADVPKSYLRWILEKMDDADSDLIHTTEHHLGLTSRRDA